MIGIYMLLLLSVAVLFKAAIEESTEITDNTPSTQPTRDAYDV